ncbi:Uncharacterized protein GBIM_15753 [Gryllus bimaculatus]|nr:Uncharacterized protein GBIM_15753 [Gryllus bimaculatus]
MLRGVWVQTAVLTVIPRRKSWAPPAGDSGWEPLQGERRRRSEAVVLRWTLYLSVYRKVEVHLEGPSDTTTVVPDECCGDGLGDVVVRHTNYDEPGGGGGVLANYFHQLTLEASATPRKTGGSPTPRRPLVTKIPEDEDSTVSNTNSNEVRVVTGEETLSAVVCLEDGLADDDSWVEEVDDRNEDFATTTATEDSSSDDEATLCRVFMVEQGPEEGAAGGGAASRRQRPPSASELEKYFFFGLGGEASAAAASTAAGLAAAAAAAKDLDSSDSCSSIYSEGVESLGGDDAAAAAGGATQRSDCDAAGADAADAAELASSRLEKYFLTGFMGFQIALFR